jgi:hypothetical protein
MRPDERPQLPLTTRRKYLVLLGAAMFLAQLGAAVALAEPTTGEGDARIGLVLLLCAASFIWSVATTLCLIRQADIPDVFTASLLVTIPPFALYALIAALAARDTAAETDVVSAMFLGITVGAMLGLLVWAASMAIARLLHLPTTDGLQDGNSDASR